MKTFDYLENSLEYITESVKKDVNFYLSISNERGLAHEAILYLNDKSIKSNDFDSEDKVYWKIYQTKDIEEVLKSALKFYNATNKGEGRKTNTVNYNVTIPCEVKDKEVYLKVADKKPILLGELK